MLYIVTEDSNSARDFWEVVAKTFKQPNEYTLVSLPTNKAGITFSGNTTLVSQVANLFGILKSGDILFVAFDNVGSTSSFNSVDFIRKTGARCNQMGVQFRYTGYYCFEEIYLSYDELIEMNKKLPVTNKVVIDALMYVQSKINCGCDYFDTSQPIQDFINKFNGAGKNREHFANILLVAATVNFKGRFKILKKGHSLHNDGECWLHNCNDIQSTMEHHQINNVCGKKCLYCCKYMGTKAKLLDLNSRSLCKNCKIDLQHI